MNATIRFKTLKSKKTGQDFEALELVAGKYTALLFPTELEKDWLKAYIKKTAEKQFDEDTQGE